MLYSGNFYLVETEEDVRVSAHSHCPFVHLNYLVRNIHIFTMSRLSLENHRIEENAPRKISGHTSWPWAQSIIEINESSSSPPCSFQLELFRMLGHLSSIPS